MYIAMNRFKIFKGKEQAFEDVWRNRESHLDQTSGFVQFHLLKGAETDEHTIYASHSVWRDEASFIAWTKSAQFRSSHKGAKSTDDLYDGPPVFEGFTPVEGV